MSNKVPVFLTTDAQAPYGRTERQRVMLSIRARSAYERSRRKLVALAHKFTPLDQEFIEFAARTQGVSKSEFMRRIVAVERMSWEKTGLFVRGRKE